MQLFLAELAANEWKAKFLAISNEKDELVAQLKTKSMTSQQIGSHGKNK